MGMGAVTDLMETETQVSNGKSRGQTVTSQGVSLETPQTDWSMSCKAMQVELKMGNDFRVFLKHVAHPHLPSVLNKLRF